MTATSLPKLRTELIPLPRDDPRVADALFTLREAALILGVPIATLHAWARGRHSVGGGSPAIVQAFVPATRGVSVPFVGLIEAYVLTVFRRAGVSLQRVRPALARLKHDVGLEYALASGHLYTDGLEVLFDYANEADSQSARVLVEPRSGQMVLREVIAKQLSRIEWGADGWATRLHLPVFRRAEVIVDVHQAFGRPLLVHGGARVEDLRDRWLGGDDMKDIARDFGVPVGECEDAIRVASQLAPAA